MDSEYIEKLKASDAKFGSGGREKVHRHAGKAIVQQKGERQVLESSSGGGRFLV